MQMDRKPITPGVSEIKDTKSSAVVYVYKSTLNGRIVVEGYEGNRKNETFIRSFNDMTGVPVQVQVFFNTIRSKENKREGRFSNAHINVGTIFYTYSANHITAAYQVIETPGSASLVLRKIALKRIAPSSNVLGTSLVEPERDNFQGNAFVKRCYRDGTCIINDIEAQIWNHEAMPAYNSNCTA